MYKNHGFTLLEGTIVVCVICLVASMSLVEYKNYMVRARVASGVNLAAAAKTAVSSYMQQNNGKTPHTNSQAGLSAQINGPYVAALRVGKGGTITVVYSLSAGSYIGGQTIEFSPEYNQAKNSIRWQCRAGTLAKDYRPKRCQGDEG